MDVAGGLAAFWVASYNHGLRRQPRSRRRCVVPLTRRLIDRFEDAGLSKCVSDANATMWWRSASGRVSPGFAPQLHCLVLAKPGYCDPDCFDFEEHVLSKYHGAPICTQKIAEAWLAHPQHPRLLSNVRHLGRAQPFNINGSVGHLIDYGEALQGMGLFRCMSPITKITLGEVMHGWGLQPDLAVPYISLPEPLPALLTCGQWTTLAVEPHSVPPEGLHASWKGKWPPADWRAQHEQAATTTHFITSRSPLNTACSCTTDMGTDLGFNDFQTTSLLNLFDWANDNFEPDRGVAQPGPQPVPQPQAESASSSDLDCDGGPRPQEAQGEAGATDPYDAFPSYVFPGSVKIAGFLHIGHNALARVCKQLPSWPRIRHSLQQVVTLFARSGSSTAFSRRLLVGRWERERARFEDENACPVLIDWR